MKSLCCKIFLWKNKTLPLFYFSFSSLFLISVEKGKEQRKKKIRKMAVARFFLSFPPSPSLSSSKAAHQPNTGLAPPSSFVRTRGRRCQPRAHRRLHPSTMPPPPLFPFFKKPPWVPLLSHYPSSLPHLRRHLFSLLSSSPLCLPPLRSTTQATEPEEINTTTAMGIAVPG